MKTTLIMAFAIFFAANVMAATEVSNINSTSISKYAPKKNDNIDKGNFEINAYFAGVIPSFVGQIAVASPRIGYFMSDSLSVGATLSLSTSNRKSSIGEDEKYLSVGPSVNWYFLKTGRFAPYVGGDFTYSKKTAGSLLSISSDNPDYYFDASARVGLQVFIIPEVAIGPALIYSAPIAFSTDSGYPNVTTNYLTLTAGVGAYF